MGGINVGRWILGGLLAGLIFNLIEFAGSMMLREKWEAAAAAHNLPTEGSPVYILMGFIGGLVAVWFYAAARTRFGPGPGTAVKVAVVYWIGGYFMAILGWSALGLFPSGMLVPWGIVSLIETITATVAGAWLYREGNVATA